MIFDIFPVLTTALLSSLIWNFFFIPPILTFHIGTPEDALMFLMYFVIALINAVLTFKIRDYEKKEHDETQRENAIKLYNTLLSSLSHELRTPISTIIGSVDTIKENEKLSLNNKKELLNEIETASIRLNRQVENLLSMSRLEANILKPKLDWCDLKELTYSVIKNNQKEASQHTVHFNSDDELPLFKVDRGLLEQVLHNILYNALVHTPINSIIEIQLYQLDNGFQWVIMDNGHGFPNDKIAFAFDKFYRISDITGGSGLGLSIVKGFVEAHLGFVKLENKQDGGAKFTITIPAEIFKSNRL